MRFIFLFIISFFSSITFAQTSSNTSDTSLIISNIIVSGNKKTKTAIILREMLLREGDTVSLSKFAAQLELSKNQIFNTALFYEVTITPAFIGQNVTLLVLVKERWYIFPLPVFKLADRNFSDWWNNHNHSLDRVDYGLKFYHNNLTGNNDKLVVEFITGYNRQIGLRYNIPYLNKKMTNGLSFSFLTIRQKETNYATNDLNKVVFAKSLNDEFLKNVTRAEITFTNRPDLFSRHNFRVGYTVEKMDDFLTKYLNPNYYGNNENEIRYVDFLYSYNYTKNNYNPYPTDGLTLSTSIYNKAFTAQNNTTQFSTFAVISNPLSKKMYIRNRVAATIKFPFETNYTNQSLFGYGIFQIRGLESYVVDGVFGAMHKFTLGYNIFDANIKAPIKNKYIGNVPFKVYAKVYNDIGYSYLPNINNLFNNQIIHGYGFGLDILTLYDLVFKFEYSFNNIGGTVFTIGLRD